MLHDENYKRLFASPLMVRDVLRACLPAHRLAAADFSSLGKLSAEYVSDELRTRHGDTVWHLRLGRRRVFLLVLLEFQAQDDRWMALRILTYSGLLYQELVRNQAPEVVGERLPAVLPVVLYNGTEPWTAATDMGALITPVGPWLAPYQSAQRCSATICLTCSGCRRMICPTATCCVRWRGWSRAGRRTTWRG